MSEKKTGIQPLPKVHAPKLAALLYAATTTHLSQIFKRHLEESTDHGIQPRAHYCERSRRRETYQSIRILWCSCIGLQRPRMARPAPRSMDPPSNDHRRPAGQLRPKCRTSTTTGHIRWCINTYRCVPMSSSSPTHGWRALQQLACW